MHSHCVTQCFPCCGSLPCSALPCVSICANTVSRSVSCVASPCPTLPCAAFACVSMCARPNTPVIRLPPDLHWLHSRKRVKPDEVLRSWDRASFMYSSITNNMQRFTMAFITIYQRFSNFFQVGTTFISQNVLRTTLLLGLSNSLGLP